jgi:hypothetical protein
MGWGVGLVGLAALSLAGGATSCASTLSDGELGTPRVVGTLRGAPPMDVLPPVSDRAGNVYVLAGKRTVPEVSVFIGRAGGGFTSGCTLTKGDRLGPLGWVGFGQDRQWYWSGGALVAVTAFGDCRRVLDRDPATGTDLEFLAVFPRVADRPSSTTLVGILRGPSDPLPFTAIVDLDSNVYTTLRAFEPADAKDIVIHGVGARAASRQGFLVTSFKQGDAIRVEGRFYDQDGALTARVGIANPGALTPYGVHGFLQASGAGLVAGVTNDKRLLLFDSTGGRAIDVAGIEPVGVHAWNDALFLVGMVGGRPAIAPILDSGALGQVVLWESSQSIADALRAPVDVTDDRAPPRRTVRFDSPRAAIGPAPLVTEHTSHPYARDTTLTLIAGPTVGEGAAAFTEIAVAPVGVAYP